MYQVVKIVSINKEVWGIGGNWYVFCRRNFRPERLEIR